MTSRASIERNSVEQRGDFLLKALQIAAELEAIGQGTRKDLKIPGLHDRNVARYLLALERAGVVTKLTNNTHGGAVYAFSGWPKARKPK